MLLFVLQYLALALTGRHLMPHYMETHTDTQFIIPELITNYTSAFVQILLFGALLSAILSTASSALLAPAAILGENIIRPRLKQISDRKLLRISRLSVLAIAVIAMVMAVRRGNIYELVGEAASVGLVSLFIPLTAGLFWKKANTRGAVTSIVAGLVVWMAASLAGTAVESILYGLLASALGMYLGSIFRKRP